MLFLFFQMEFSNVLLFKRIFVEDGVQIFLNLITFIFGVFFCFSFDGFGLKRGEFLRAPSVITLLVRLRNKCHIEKQVFAPSRVVALG